MTIKNFINKNRAIIINFGRNIFILFILLSILDKFSILDINHVLNLRHFFVISIFFGTLSYILWQEKSDFRIRKDSIKYLFLVSLALITFSSVKFELMKGFTEFLLPYQFYLFSITISLGIIVLWGNKEAIDRIDQEKIKEETEEEKRKENFAKIHPKMNSMPILRCLLKWMYKQGWGYVLGLILILILFIFIKYPYMDLDFTGSHNMKYSSYVGPAKHMLDNGMLLNQKKYLADPVYLVNGTYSAFGVYPVMEWGLYFTFKLFPYNSIEFNTRLFTTTVGVLILIFAYLFFKNFLPKKQTLFLLFLLSINVIIQFFTYVTVLDSIMLLCFFMSLYLLIKGLSIKKIQNIFLSGVIAGIGINLKYSLIIFLLPIVFVLICFFKKEGLAKHINYLLIFLPNLILPTFIFRLSLRYLPRDPLLYGFLFLVLAGIYLFLYINIKNISNFSERIIKKYLNDKRTYPFIFISMVAIILFIIIFLTKIEWILDLIKHFITDRYLILNWNMYNTFLLRFKLWLTNPIYYTGLIGVISIIFFKVKKIKLISFGFLISALIYFILTSKVLYFHEYYHHIIIITFMVFASNLLYFSYKSLIKTNLKIIFVILILILIIPSCLDNVKSKLSKHREGVIETGNYLKGHMTNDEFVILSTQIPSSISIYADRKSWNENDVFITNKINNKITKVFRTELASNSNVSEIMQKYKTKYYVTKGKEKFNKRGFAYLFDSYFKREISNYSFRTILILCKEQNICVYEAEKERINELFEYNIRPYLKLEEQISNYYIYRFYD